MLSKSLSMAIVLMLSVWLYTTYSVSAQSLKIAPLIYDDATLGKGEVKKGFVDISNPESTKNTVALQVKAFRQIDDEGGLEFYASEQVAAGVKLDFDRVTLEPRGAMRVYFVLDGAKLPQGDVFAAVLASTIPDGTAAAAQSVSVGTLLVIQNGTPSSHQADITSFTTSWLQIGDGLSAAMKLHNPADPKSATGFFPSVRVAIQPYGATTVKGPLLFAGRTRSVEYRQNGDYFGLIYLKASSGSSEKGQIVFAITGYWRWLAPIIAAVVIMILVLGQRVRLVKHKKSLYRA